jgi:hypothetical protein
MDAAPMLDIPFVEVRDIVGVECVPVWEGLDKIGAQDLGLCVWVESKLVKSRLQGTRCVKLEMTTPAFGFTEEHRRELT